jgi:hypothetical protein
MRHLLRSTNTCWMSWYPTTPPRLQSYPSPTTQSNLRDLEAIWLAPTIRHPAIP